MDSFYGMLLVSWAPWLIISATALYVGVRRARALERRDSANTDLRALQDRVAVLEDALAAAIIDIARIEDGQRFTTELIGSRDLSRQPPRAMP